VSLSYRPTSVADVVTWLIVGTLVVAAVVVFGILL
jgi:hypothetical protein